MIIFSLSYQNAKDSIPLSVFGFLPDDGWYEVSVYQSQGDPPAPGMGTNCLTQFGYTDRTGPVAPRTVGYLLSNANPVNHPAVFPLSIPFWGIANTPVTFQATMNAPGQGGVNIDVVLRKL